MRKLVPAVVAVAALLIGGAVILVSRIDADAIGQEVVQQANAIDGVELSVSDFDLGLFSGLKLGKTQGALDMPAGRVDAELDSLTFEHELMPLLRGQVSVRQIRLDRPVLTLVAREVAGSGAGAGATSQTAPPAGSALSVAIRQILLRDGKISARAEEEAGSFEAQGIDMTLTDIALDSAAVSAALGLSAAGTLEVERVRMGGMNAGQVKGEMTVEKGLMKATAVLRGAGGQLTAETFELNLGLDPLEYRMVLKGKIDPAQVLGKQIGEGFGLADMDMTGSGRGPESKGFVGEGVIRLAEGTMPATVLLSGMEKFLGESSLEGSSYEATEVRFRIVDDRLVLEPFQLTGEKMRIDASGWIDMAGPLALKMKVGVPKERASAGDVSEAQSAAMTDAEGWTTVPLLVSGTSEDPSVGLDKAEIAGAAASRAKDAAKKGLKSLFK